MALLILIGCYCAMVVLAILSLIFFIKGITHVILSEYSKPIAASLTSSMQSREISLKKAKNNGNLEMVEKMSDVVDRLTIDEDIYETRYRYHKSNISICFV